MSEERSLYKKLIWFIGLWLAGVLSLTIIGYVIRFAIGL